MLVEGVDDIEKDMTSYNSALESLIFDFVWGEFVNACELFVEVDGVLVIVGCVVFLDLDFVTNVIVDEAEVTVFCISVFE